MLIPIVMIVLILTLMLSSDPLDETWSWLSSWGSSTSLACPIRGAYDNFLIVVSIGVKR
jgi:hypothetical protein